MKVQLNSLLRQKKGFESGDPATHDAILEAEKTLGLVFSEEYKQYLSEFGAVTFVGHTLTGISPFPGLNVVLVTQEMREYNPEVKNNLYVIEEAHIDGIVVWQDESGAVYLTAPNQKAQIIADSLADYLADDTEPDVDDVPE